MSSEHPKRMEATTVKLKRKRMSSCQGSNKCKAMRAKNKRRMRKKKIRKTKRRRLISVHNNLDHPGSSLIVDNDVVVSSLNAPDDVVVAQILSRLPVKSLMRFKCVCKHWKSIIEENSHFINLHLSHSETRPSLFILLLKTAERLTKGKYQSFLSADLHFNGSRYANIDTLRKTQSFSYNEVLGPVGGLICFVDTFAVRIYNVSTGEVTPWIKSTVSASVEKENGVIDVFTPLPQCNFGFDPTTNEHKVVFIWCERRFQKFPVCEVLTVGDNTWRVIHDLPPYIHFGTATVSANGSIYWNLFRPFGDDTRIKLRVESPNSEAVESSDEEEDYTEWIMAFDIGSEKFRMIPVPPVPESEQDELFNCNAFSLSVVDGCLAITRRMERKLKMWIFHDQIKEKGTSITSSGKDWTQLSIDFPSELTIRLRQSVIYVHSVPGTDEIILETYGGIYTRGLRNVKTAKFYYYDRKKKSLRKLEINGISSIPEDCRAECSTFVESLLPVLKKL